VDSKNLIKNEEHSMVHNKCIRIFDSHLKYHIHCFPT